MPPKWELPFDQLRGILPNPHLVPGMWPGLLQVGNINLAKRPVVRNPDGSVSTVKSTSFNLDDREVLVPQVVGGRVVSPRASLLNFLSTGQNLGTFSSPSAANNYASALHRQQDHAYAKAQVLNALRLLLAPRPPR